MDILNVLSTNFKGTRELNHPPRISQFAHNRKNTFYSAGLLGQDLVDFLRGQQIHACLRKGRGELEFDIKNNTIALDAVALHNPI